MRVLLIAFTYNLPYNVLRCLSMAGMEVCVYGNCTAKYLKYSRYCKSYTTHSFAVGETSMEDIFINIKEQMTISGADLVLPSDLVSTNLLCLFNSGSNANMITNILPFIDVFNYMKDKLNFYNFCRTNNFPTPLTWQYNSFDELMKSIFRRDITFPIMFKPTDMMGGRGVGIANSAYDLLFFKEMSVSSYIFQEIIDGDDYSLPIIIHNGQLMTYVFQKHVSWGYKYISNPYIESLAKNLAKIIGGSGVFHFDVIVNRYTQEPYLIECNPRFWFSVFAPCILGVNFAEQSISLEKPSEPFFASIDGKKLYLKHHLLKKICNIFSITHEDLLMLKYYMLDPIGILIQFSHLASDHVPKVDGSIEDQADMCKIINKQLISLH